MNNTILIATTILLFISIVNTNNCPRNITSKDISYRQLSLIIDGFDNRFVSYQYNKIENGIVTIETQVNLSFYIVIPLELTGDKTEDMKNQNFKIEYDESILMLSSARLRGDNLERLGGDKRDKLYLLFAPIVETQEKQTEIRIRKDNRPSYQDDVISVKVNKISEDYNVYVLFEEKELIKRMEKSKCLF